MSEEFQRLGAVRGVLVVVVAAIVAVLALSFSGMSVAAPDHAVATVRPEVPAAALAAGPAPRRAAAGHRRRRRAAPRRKRCRPVAGVSFTVTMAQRCPKPLKHAGSGPHLPAKLRRAASRPRPVLVAPGRQRAGATTTTPKQPATTTKQPATTITAKPAAPAQAGAKRSAGAAGAGVTSTNGAVTAQDDGAGAR
jgi:hypothetical protein